MEDGNRPGGPQCPRVCPPSLHCDLHPPDKKWHFFPPKKLSPLGSRPGMKSLGSVTNDPEGEEKGESLHSWAEKLS